MFTISLPVESHSLQHPGYLKHGGITHVLLRYPWKDLKRGARVSNTWGNDSFSPTVPVEFPQKRTRNPIHGEGGSYHQHHPLKIPHTHPCLSFKAIHNTPYQTIIGNDTLLFKYGIVNLHLAVLNIRDILKPYIIADCYWQ